MLVRRCFRGIAKKGQSGQAGAAIEGSILDAGGALTDRDAGQAGAFIKGAFLDAGDRLAFNCRRNG